MGLDPNKLPDSVISKIDKKDRPKGRITQAEAETRYSNRLERDEQRLFAQWCGLREARAEFLFDWTRTDKPVTGRVGLPDFRIYLPGGLTVFYEFKSTEGRLTKTQRLVHEILTGLGYVVEIVKTADEAVKSARSWYEVALSQKAMKTRPAGK
jgi:hypothetical protein